jgi:hypothetical protein
VSYGIREVHPCQESKGVETNKKVVRVRPGDFTAYIKAFGFIDSVGFYIIDVVDDIPRNRYADG